MQDLECAMHLIEQLLFHCYAITCLLFIALLYFHHAKANFTLFINYRNLITYINL